MDTDELMISNMFGDIIACFRLHSGTIAVLKKRSDLHAVLKRYWITNKLENDELVLFNWWIGNTFGVSINELRAT